MDCALHGEEAYPSKKAYVQDKVSAPVSPKPDVENENLGAITQPSSASKPTLLVVDELETTTHQGESTNRSCVVITGRSCLAEVAVPLN